MAVQYQSNKSILAFIREGDARIKDNETLEQDVGRGIVPLAQYTVLAQKAASRKWVPLTSVDPTLTPGKMVCGDLGTSIAAFRGISDGEFAVTIDGVAMNITGLDFTGIELSTGTVASAVCGALGTNLAGMQAVADGAYNITVDGQVCAITGLDFSAIAALPEIPDVINAKALGRFIAVWDSKTTKVEFHSLRKGALSTITALSAPAGGTDISGAGFLNGLTGTAVLAQGSGTDDLDLQIADIIEDKAAGRFHVLSNGSRLQFISPTLGTQSTVSVLSAVAGGAGTNISGAGFLNGLTGTGVATAGTGLDGSTLPTGILISSEVAAALLVAGDVTGQCVLIGGNVVVDGDAMVLEGSLARTSVVVDRGQTIESCLADRGIFCAETRDISAYQA